MFKISKSIIAVLAVSALIFGISGCKKSETPAEDAGQKIDEAVDKADNKINSTVDKAGQSLKDAGQRVKDSVK